MKWYNIFTYNEGKLFWKIPTSGRITNGKEAGSLHNGYIVICVQNKKYKAHNIIWEMHNGPIPEGYVIDHINHIRSDNRIENLRMITKQENMKNMPLSRRNKSGCIGVWWNEANKKWIVRVMISGVYRHIGCFNSYLDACNASKEAHEIGGYYKEHGSAQSQ
ncbi:TPA: HNH endonuclease signature motif containing protein [Escherichia coli]